MAKSTQCEANVWEGGHYPRQCERMATWTVNGSRYCTQHAKQRLPKVRRTLRVEVPELPPGSYTGTVTRVRKVRNKPQVRMTFQIDRPKQVDVEFLEMDTSDLIGKVVRVKLSPLVKGGKL